MSSLAVRQDAARHPCIVDLIDDHDEAYETWKRLGIRGQVLLHLDAHIDFEWMAEKDPNSLLRLTSFQELERSLKNLRGWTMSNPAHNHLNLGNYLYQALQEGMVREWYWVVPDSLWQSPISRNRIWKDLLAYYRFRSAPMEFPKNEGDIFRTSFLGVPTVITSLAHLPQFTGPVLLNIDVDYLTTIPVSSPIKAERLRRELPWIWPDDLAAVLHGKNISSEMIAIAHSVNQGYTPIQFKFFGEVLRSLLSGEGAPPDYEQIKEAFFLRCQGETKAALNLLSSLQSGGALEAARLYQMAQMLYEEGRYEEARSEFRECSSLDPEFLSPYNTRARFFDMRGRPGEAYKEHQMMRVLCPEVIEPIAGEARYFAAVGDDGQAIQKYQEVLRRDPNHAEAHHALGVLMLRRKNIEEALVYFRHAVEFDPEDLRALIGMGECLLRINRLGEAKTCLREALGQGAHYPFTYDLLGRVYWRLGYPFKAWELLLECWRLRGLYALKFIRYMIQKMSFQIQEAFL